jgi:hypothetical protein
VIVRFGDSSSSDVLRTKTRVHGVRGDRGDYPAAELG